MVANSAMLAALVLLSTRIPGRTRLLRADVGPRDEQRACASLVRML
jgi:hypothetical protein